MDEERTVFLSAETLPPKLYILCQGKAEEVPLSGRQSVGRATRSQTRDISLTSGVVSRSHGEFVTTPTSCTYEDLGSTNGTLCNGCELLPHTPCRLVDGDVLRIHGRADPRCELDVVLLYTTSYPSNALWQKLRLEEDMAEVAVGRMSDLAPNTPALSRRHASFFHAEGGWSILDHGSLNGVLLNNHRLSQPSYLRPMDVVRMAGLFFLFTGDTLFYQTIPEPHPIQQAVAESPVPSCADVGGASPSVHRAVGKAEPAPQEKRADPAPDPGGGRACPAGRACLADRACPADGALCVWIEARNVWERMKKRTLLRDIHLQIGTGEMVLVLGGSGAGKTTFLNAVMGYEPAEGKVLYQGVDIYDEYEKMKYEIGYVPQQDLLRMNDTVYDTLLNAARMRLPKGYRGYEAKVEATMELLGLAREQDSLVRQLSGGQRKRLSIAVEYIGDPSLFFLDEPDSGLDGTMARALMENLRTIADRGKIVLVISHSPDRAFELFDKVIVLAKSERDNAGRLAFYGSPKEACRFFGVDTLEHIVRRINRPDEGGEGLADHYIDLFAKEGNG